ncbi:MAG: FGGY-family carbohydrate kinase [Candidatus Limnocylindrales bacterium]
MTLLLGIDIGTTATKAILLDSDVGLVAEAQRPVTLHADHPGWAEEDVDEWWSNVAALTRELTRERAPAAVGISGMVPCVVLLDARGRPLRRSIQQNDARATAEIDELRQELAGASILRRTGSPITQQSVAPTVRWLARHEPEALAAATTLHGSYDAMVSRLTGARSVELNWAVESGLFDLETDAWAEDVLEAAGLDVSLLPPVRRPADIVGEVSAAAAAETGLRVGTPVIAGSADHVASAFAAGLVREGDLLVKLGGAGDILAVTSTPVTDERLYLDIHLSPGLYLPNGCMASSGSFIRWFQRELAGGASLATLDAEAEASGPGAGGIVALPYMLGEKTPINDPAARGAFIGMSLSHRRGDLFRAVLESIAFGFRHHLDVLAELGLTPSRVRVTNGGASSRLWTQVTADVIGLPLEKLRSHPGSALGVAFAAGMAVGAFTSWSDIERFVEPGEMVEPRDHEAYAEAYARYRALYPALQGLGG